jgi:hypothetical protein
VVLYQIKQSLLDFQQQLNILIPAKIATIRAKLFNYIKKNFFNCPERPGTNFALSKQTGGGSKEKLTVKAARL